MTLLFQKGSCYLHLTRVRDLSHLSGETSKGVKAAQKPLLETKRRESRVSIVQHLQFLACLFRSNKLITQHIYRPCRSMPQKEVIDN
ncbi:hypothetical protein CEXT_320271 [Caerostris extrusa]|uniref:Uncharacterized protein n=1 Tax=Caerostris extrusa TaxID=172846 RepID=A0AAV4XVM9_CAEEX|nr:hypothetical protein CEXT_320271 [Caerostris extrusa]